MADPLTGAISHCTDCGGEEFFVTSEDGGQEINPSINEGIFTMFFRDALMRVYNDFDNRRTGIVDRHQMSSLLHAFDECEDYQQETSENEILL